MSVIRALAGLSERAVTFTLDKETEPYSENNLHGAQAAGACAGEVVYEETARGPFVITLYEKMIKKEFRESLLYKVCPISSFAYGIACHEIGHTIGPAGWCTFDSEPGFNTMQVGMNPLIQMLDNIFEDARIEYQLMFMYPQLAPFVQLQLASLMWQFTIEVDKGLSRDIDSLFHLVRFGSLIEGHDPVLMNAAWPVVNAMVPGDRAGCVETVQFIANLLAEKHPDALDGMRYGQVVQAVMKKGDAQKALQGQKVAPTPALDVLNKLVLIKDKQLDPSALAGVDGPPVEETSKDDRFYNQAIQLYGNTIQELSMVFTRYKYRPRRVKSRDGDFSPYIGDQINAYTASLLGEESKSYLTSKKVFPDLQLAVLWDVSDSTSAYQEVYGYAVIALLAALEDKIGCRTALIAFNSHATELMPMGGLISKAKIYPRSSGGTNLMPALKMAFEKYTWTARQKHLLIVTDGDASDWEEARNYIQRLQREIGILPRLVNVAPGEETAGIASDVPWSSAAPIEQLPELIMQDMVSV